MIRTLIVEDSLVVQQLLRHILESDPHITVVGVANNGQEALPAVMSLKPDVVTMDIHMPKLDGFEATRLIMAHRPTPIVIVSGGSDVNEVHFSFQAVEVGALAVISRPPGPGHPDHPAAARELVQTVKLMSEVRVVTRKPRPAPAPTSLALANTPPLVHQTEVAAIGASTGGPVILKQILSRLPANLPFPILIAQHIAEGFVAGFVEWLADVARFPLRIARHGDPLWPGCGYLAPDGFHLGVKPGPRLVLSDHAPEYSVRPSVAYLFRTVAEVFGPRAVGVLLTGMGSDGARELGLMRQRGAITLAQDQASSVIYGMPGAAAALGAAIHILPPEGIAAFIATLAKKTKGANHGHPEQRPGPA